MITEKQNYADRLELFVNETFYSTLVKHGENYAGIESSYSFNITWSISNLEYLEIKSPGYKEIQTAEFHVVLPQDFIQGIRW